MAAFVLAASGELPSAALGSTARVVYRIADSRIGEASGLAVGRTSPGIEYVQNDSGDTNRFFALDARTGVTAATVTVRGARNVDWEDLAVAPDPAGVSSVWLADIGDNDAGRSEVRIYRVPEPRIARTDRGRELRTRAAEIWRLRYPTGPIDAESLAVTPAGTAYVITKSFLGESTVYRVPPHPDRHRVQVLQPVARISFAPTGTPNPFGTVGQLTATGAAISPDGGIIAVRTYADAYFWRVRGGDVPAALRRRPIRVALPEQKQGEGIAVTPGSVLIDSEGVRAPVYSLPTPRLPAHAAAAVPVGRPASSPAATSSVHDSGGVSLGWLAAGLVTAVGLGTAMIWWWRGRISACRSPRNPPP